MRPKTRTTTPTEQPMSEERQDVEAELRKLDSDAKEQERTAAMTGDLNDAAYYAGIRAGIAKATLAAIGEIRTLREQVERLTRENTEGLETLRFLNRECLDQQARADTLQRKVEALRARCDSRISSIIADGYDIGEATDEIGDAVAEWVKEGTPNPFEAEADAVLERRALTTEGGE